MKRFLVLILSAAMMTLAAPAVPAEAAPVCTSDRESGSKVLFWEEGERSVTVVQTVYQFDCSDGDRFTDYVVDFRTSSCKGIQEFQANMYGIAKVDRGLTKRACQKRPGYDGAKFTQSLYNCFYVQGAGDRTAGGWVKARVAYNADPSGRIREFYVA